MSALALARVLVFHLLTAEDEMSIGCYVFTFDSPPATKLVATLSFGPNLADRRKR
jgi:hypothetical protein